MVITKFRGKLRCGFCGEVREVSIGKSEGAGKKGTVSSQVVCFGCGNYIPHKNKV